MNDYQALEYHIILQMLAELALSDGAKKLAETLRPELNESTCRAWMRQTTQAKIILESCGNPPLSSMMELEKTLALCEKDAMLLPEQLTAVAQFLLSCKRMKAYLKKAEATGSDLAFYGGALEPMENLYDEIDRSIQNGMLADDASVALRSIRRRIDITGAQIKDKLSAMLKGQDGIFAENFVAVRDGRFVLPVRREHKSKVNGTVVGLSGSGGTVFIEPASVTRLQNALSLLKIEESNEERRILYILTGQVTEEMGTIRCNIEAMETLDFAFAKAKLSAQMDAGPAEISPDGRLIINDGRHPLLKREACVPLQFTMKDGIRGVVITGPNTGGKTVALKTVGLLSMMAQSGLHVPAGPGSSFVMRNLYLCDIGDGQSITENLSTFSSHMKNIISILQRTGNQSLVLLDELGSGTDPAEGMGIAIAVLGALCRKGCLFVATTHYPEVKEFAETQPGLTNARMAFDREKLSPLYRLEMGEGGRSCALYIAQKLGFPEDLLETAREASLHRAVREDSSQAVRPTAPTVSGHDPSPSGPSISREKKKPDTEDRAGDRFNLGDSVIVYPDKQTGIVCRTADERGMIQVLVKKEKKMISHKRLKLRVPADRLYPPDYDFSIVFDTVANRKARHVMDKRHDPNAVVTLEQGKEIES